MYNLDDKDHLLILALKKNSRVSLVSLGRDIGLSRSATHDRITRLEELGVIKAYTVIIDEKARPMLRAFLTVKLLVGIDTEVMASTVAEKEGVISTYCLSGDIDMIVYCECRNVAEMAELRDELSMLEGITEISTRNIMSSINDNSGIR